MGNTQSGISISVGDVLGLGLSAVSAVEWDPLIISLTDLHFSETS